jgi:hypothetical protein
VIQHRHHIISEREREVIARARLQRLMHRAGHAASGRRELGVGRPLVKTSPWVAVSIDWNMWDQSLAHQLERGDTHRSTMDQSLAQAQPLVALATTLTIPPRPAVVILCSYHTRTTRGSTNPSSLQSQGFQYRNTADLPPGYPPFNQRGSTAADDDRHKPPDFSHRQPAGDDDGRARMSPPERRGGNQRTSPQERREYRAPQEEFYRTPQRKGMSRRPRRRSDQCYTSVSTKRPLGVNRAADTTLRTTTCVGRTRTCPPLSARISVTPKNKQVNVTHVLNFTHTGLTEHEPHISHYETHNWLSSISPKREEGWELRTRHQRILLHSNGTHN